MATVCPSVVAFTPSPGPFLTRRCDEFEPADTFRRCGDQAARGREWATAAAARGNPVRAGRKHQVKAPSMVSADACAASEGLEGVQEKSRPALRTTLLRTRSERQLHLPSALASPNLHPEFSSSYRSTLARETPVSSSGICHEYLRRRLGRGPLLAAMTSSGAGVRPSRVDAALVAVQLIQAGLTDAVTATEPWRSNRCRIAGLRRQEGQLHGVGRPLLHTRATTPSPPERRGTFSLQYSTLVSRHQSLLPRLRRCQLANRVGQLTNRSLE